MAERLARVLLAALMFAAPLAQALQTGEPLPTLAVEKMGEIRIEDGETRFSPWQSAGLADRIHIVQYLAARMSARKMSKPFTDRLEKSGIPYARYHITTVVNLDDALFGTRGMVLSELEKNKRKYALSTIVADESGRGRELWALAESSSAVIILDPAGRVLYFHEGAMREDDIERAIAVVRGDGDVAATR